VKAPGQFYPDDFGADFNNSTIYLAQFMGWLPDLMPVNKRTAYRIVAEDDPTDDEPPYVLGEGTLINHIYDSEGKLISYQSDDLTFTSIWNCDSGKQGTPN
jgi:hypothetical protein